MCIRDRESAVRQYSERYDQWSPARFTVDRSEVESARASVDDELAEHIEKAREQVGRFARRQLETMLELEVETLPGVVLGHRHVPVEAVGSYSPGGVYPLIASSIMTLAAYRISAPTTKVSIITQNHSYFVYSFVSTTLVS